MEDMDLEREQDKMKREDMPESGVLAKNMAEIGGEVVSINRKCGLEGDSGAKQRRRGGFDGWRCGRPHCPARAPNCEGNLVKLVSGTST